jgi:diadenylate cyclase
MDLLMQLSWRDGIDILIITVVIYHLSLLIRGTRAAQMVTGILIIVGTFLLSNLVPLTTLSWVMNKFYSSFIIILIILFQEDIRHMLSRIGKKSIISGVESISSQQILDEITRAAASLASKRIGALIVVERNIILNRYVEAGVTIDGRVTKELLVSVFHPSSPIHDGAVVIQRGRVAAAGCFLPLTKAQNLDPNMGTRHRAAIGISEETDAVVVLVSEEGGSISMVVDGVVSKKLDPKGLKSALVEMISDQNDNEIEPKAGAIGGSRPT